MVRHRCWKCKGCGRVRIHPRTLADWVAGALVAPVIEWLFQDRNDDHEWKDCPVCEGKGWQVKGDYS
jgi:hypothetical protein